MPSTEMADTKLIINASDTVLENLMLTQLVNTCQPYNSSLCAHQVAAYMYFTSAVITFLHIL